MPSPNSGPGLLIAFEGIDGTGKSTLATLVTTQLRELGHDVVQTREPTSGRFGRRLRESAASGRLDAEAELELFMDDRREHVREVIRPNLASGRLVIVDRYYYSSAAYQGARGLDWQDIVHRNEAFAPCPDVLFVLDLEVDEALRRISGRGTAHDLFENRDYLGRVRQLFRCVNHAGLVVLDARQPVVDLCRQATGAILEKMNGCGDGNGGEIRKTG